MDGMARRRDPILDTAPHAEVLSDEVGECRHCGQRIGHMDRPAGVGVLWFHLDRPECGSAFCGAVGDSTTAAPAPAPMAEERPSS